MLCKDPLRSRFFQPRLRGYLGFLAFLGITLGLVPSGWGQIDFIDGGFSYRDGTYISYSIDIGQPTIFKVANGSATLEGNVTGPGLLEKTGAGTLTLLGTNSYTGGSTVSHPTTSSDPNAPLFKMLYKKPVGGKVGLSESFLDLMKEAGIDKNTVVEKKKGSKGRSFNALTFHSLRHTFVSTMTNMGVSQELRMKLAGHTSDVYQRYTHHELGTLRNALEKFPTFL